MSLYSRVQSLNKKKIRENFLIKLVLLLLFFYFIVTNIV